MSMEDEIATYLWSVVDSKVILGKPETGTLDKAFAADSKIGNLRATRGCEICGEMVFYNPTDPTTLICKPCARDFPEPADPPENEFCIVVPNNGVYLVRVTRVG